TPSASPEPLAPATPPAHREKALQRNRAAAHRCRQRKKQRATQLDEQCRALRARNAQLEDETTRLRREVCGLKTLLLQHDGCQFGPIDAYI
ncbi:hypothetical protein B0J12DRAFT_536391, partial [Macrophomina phaseolina]